MTLDLFASRVDSTGTVHPPISDSIDASGDCWEWTGYLNPKGYGRVKSKATGEVLAHRVVWAYLVGPIQEEMTLDHLCRNRRCVNPDHLEPVSMIENVARGFPRRIFICPAGHDKRVTGRTAVNRGCDECGRIRSREYQRRKRAGLLA